MDRVEGSHKGRVLLATVKGDVHDIGKNLVDIILSNNGYDVVNLGIKVPPARLLEAVNEHAPDVIGLSGLLVKSAQQMIATAEDLHDAGVRTPILVGGAALSRNFTVKRIRPAYGEELVLYAKDAMDGLFLLDRVMDADRRAELIELAGRTDGAAPRAAERDRAPSVAPSRRSALVSTDVSIPDPPDTESHHERFDDLDELWDWVNPQMLYGRHMGLKGAARKIAAGDPKALKVVEQVEGAKRLFRDEGLRVESVWRFFRATSEGNRLLLRGEDGSETAHFDLPRQAKEDGLSIADYVLPAVGNNGSRRWDHVAMFVTTAGAGVRELADDLKERGEYVLCHALQALAIESAEAAAELLHARLRERWGFPDAAGATMMDRFQAKYRGKRYSFGSPACPALEMQETLFELLDTDAIGVQLTEGHMMEPEASVSALVFHHPGASYFSV
jgi:5-methyltetrahydrofolate--homocysteine methyltransferase